MLINLTWSLPYRVKDDVDRVVERAVQAKDDRAAREKVAELVGDAVRASAPSPPRRPRR